MENQTAKARVAREVIEPISINVSPAEATTWLTRGRIIYLLMGFFALVLLFAFWFLISAKTVIVVIEPTPDEVNLSGGSLSLKLEQRFLAQPGKFQLHATKQGYYPLQEEIAVGMLKTYTIERTLEKKPGLVSISTETNDPALVYIDDQYVGVAPLTDIALTPGTHAVTLQQYRFLPVLTEIQVEGAEQQQSFTFDLIPNWVAVDFVTKPAGASIWLDGDLYGKTPNSVEVDAGTHHLELIHPDFAAHVTDFAVLANQALDLGVIELSRTPTHILINSTPTQATVFINEQQQGVTPLTITAAPNTNYSVRFVKNGYRSLTRTVRVKPGESKSLSVGLEPILGVIDLTVTPRTAKILVDGKTVGTGNQTLSLTTRPHNIEIRESGYIAQTLQVLPSTAQPQQHIVALKLRNTNANGTPATITNGQGQQLRLIRPNRFTMGSSRREQGRRSNEALREVELKRAFYIGTKEISNQEYARFDPQHKSGSFSGVDLSGATLPVVNVTWEQAARYCNWLSEQEDLPIIYREKNGVLVADEKLTTGYRLVTEAEWAWVARVQSSSNVLRYGWGDAYPPSNIFENFADEKVKNVVALTIPSYDDGYIGTAPIGSFAVNHNGVFDIYGNVAEWVHDYYTIYAPTSQIEVDPVGPNQGKHHVVRGASWLRGELSNTRLAYRDYRVKSQPDIGFRIARYIN